MEFNILPYGFILILDDFGLHFYALHFFIGRYVQHAVKIAVVPDPVIVPDIDVPSEREIGQYDIYSIVVLDSELPRFLPDISPCPVHFPEIPVNCFTEIIYTLLLAPNLDDFLQCSCPHNLKISIFDTNPEEIETRAGPR